MAETTLSQRATKQQDSLAQLYSPSWVDRLTDWVSGLPGPRWLFYLLLALAIRLTSIVIQTVETGSSNIFGFFPAVVALSLPYSLALIHHLDDVADSALAQFRPNMVVDDDEYEQIQYRLTTMPNISALISSLVGAGIIVALFFITGLDFFKNFGVFTSPVTTAYQIALNLVLWAVFATLVYHTVRQLRMVREIYDRDTQINFFKLQPVYAFSTLTARTAIGFIIIVYAWVSAAPGLLERPQTAVVLGGFVLLAAIAFVWPLLGMHKLLVEEQRRLLTEAGERLEATIADLHQRSAECDYKDMPNVNSAIDSFIKEQEVLKKTSTWPWQPETLRGVATGLLLPIIVWVITRALERFTGF